MALCTVVDGACKECDGVVTRVNNVNKNIHKLNAVVNGVNKNIFGLYLDDNIGKVFIRVEKIIKSDYDFTNSKFGTGTTLDVADWADYLTVSYDSKNMLWYFCTNPIGPGGYIDIRLNFYAVPKSNLGGGGYKITGNIFKNIPPVTLDFNYSTSQTSSISLKTCANGWYMYNTSVGESLINILSSNLCNTKLTPASGSITEAISRPGYDNIIVRIGSVASSSSVTSKHVGKYFGVKVNNFQLGNFIGFPNISSFATNSVYKATWATKVIDHFELFPVFVLGGDMSSTYNGNTSGAGCHAAINDTVRLLDGSSSDFHTITMPDSNSLSVSPVGNADSDRYRFTILAWDIRAVYDDGSIQKLSDIPNGAWLTHIAYLYKSSATNANSLGTSEDALLPGPYNEVTANNGITYKIPYGFMDRFDQRQKMSNSASENEYNSHEIKVNTYSIEGKTFKYLGIVQTSQNCQTPHSKIQIQKVFYMGYPYDCNAVLN